MINLKAIPTINYGALDKDGAAALNRIFNTLDTSNGELRIQWDTPASLAKAANISEEKAAALIKYLTDNNLAYYDKSAPGLYLNYQALPDKYRRKYSQ